MEKETINTLEQSLISIINKATSGIEKGVDFLSAEIPDVIQQLLLWHGVKNFVIFVLGIVFLVAGIKLFQKSHSITQKEGFTCFDNDGIDITRHFLGVIIWGVISIVNIITGLCLINLKWLQIWLAPKVWLIEYVASLVK